MSDQQPPTPEGGAPPPFPTWPTATPAPPGAGVQSAMSFSAPTFTPIPFDIGGELFYAAGVAPGGTLLDMAALASVPDTEKVLALTGFLDGVLLPESAVRFAGRLRDPERPIDLPLLAEVVKWLVGRYAPGVPTGGPSFLPSTPGTTGPTSTDGAVLTGSTPGPTS